MIGAKVMLADDREVASLWLRAKPAVGEYLWITGEAGERAAREFGASSFVVVELAHWVNAAWSPQSHTGDPIHALAIYVKPVERALAEDEE